MLGVLNSKRCFALAMSLAVPTFACETDPGVSDWYCEDETSNGIGEADERRSES